MCERKNILDLVNGESNFIDYDDIVDNELFDSEDFDNDSNDLFDSDAND